MISIEGATKKSYRVGAVVAAIHFVLSWVVIVHIGSNRPDALWQMEWFVFFIPDLPVALFWLWLIRVIPDIAIERLPEPICYTSDFLIPAFVFGVVSPVLWYFIPPLYSAYRSRHPRWHYYDMK